LLILVLAGVGYGFLWRQGEILYSPHSDIIVHGLGIKTALYDAVHEGRGIPFWREDQLSGYPAFTNPQALYTYPLHFLFYLLKPWNAVGGTLWLHFVAAAWVLYLVGAVLGLGKWARLFMAVSAMFNFKLVLAAYAGWLPVIPAITFFPLLFAATFYVVQKRNLGGTLFFGASVAFCLHTGHLQLIYYTTCFVGMYLLVKALTWLRKRQWHILRYAGLSLLCGAILGAAMVAYLLIPLAAEVPLISRAEASYDFFKFHHVLTLRHLLTFLYPEALGSPLTGDYIGKELWEDVGYFGLIPLVLAIAGAVWGWQRRSVARFLAISFLLSVILTMDSPLLRFLYDVLPGFAVFRCPSRFLFLTAFFGITLAGMGLEETMVRVRKCFRSPFLVPIIAGCVLITVSGEGVFYAHRYLNTVPFRQVIPATGYQEFLSSDTAIFRVATLYRPTINYGWAASMGLQMIGGYDPFNFNHYQAYFEVLKWGTVRPEKRRRVWTDLTSISRGDLLDALNVKYLISPNRLTKRSKRFELVGHWRGQPIFVLYHGMRQGDIYVYRNNNCLPRAFWVDELVEVEDEQKMLSLMKQKRLGHTAVTVGSMHTSISFSDSPEDQVEVVGASGGHLALQTQSRTRRFLVISEVWHPGWRAFVDGIELPLHRTDVALMGVFVPSGKHKVELHFHPMYWTVALGTSTVSGIAFLLLLITLCRQWWQTGLTPMDLRKSQTRESNNRKNLPSLDA
jgi:hypothetical protein